ncbi:uncharacterized protein LOC113791280 [Dermatophagoides pteronyssinus]|uniref:Uncharacterized protein LOC113791280 n=1 Tax=Dermatophagoides pteronyssinus TaxID=6956 RepID=A0A6P6XU50_DERPT|nr:uncharacterized protein LOC113791280 [Dermatophagoides pteronyssinus]
MEHPSSSSSSSWFVNRIGNGGNETNVMDVGTFFSLTNPSLIQQNNNNNNAVTDQQIHLNSQTQTTTISSVALIDHLQQSLQQEQARRIEIEKELISLKQKYMELQREVTETKALQENSLSMQRTHLESIKKRLINTLNMAIDSNNQSHELTTDPPKLQRLIEYIHECDECQFKTKSNVSLILHKMNHQITDHHYMLSTTSFTTRNSNSKSIYKCSACDTDKLTRHQVYRHIYDLHTTEKPLSCPYCEFTFTHNDYLEQHIPIKHGKATFASLSSSKPAQLYYHNDGPIHTNSNSHSGSNNSSHSLTTTITEVDPSTSSPTYELQSSNRNKNRRQTTSKNISQTDLKCTFPDCNFVTIFPSTLDFHLQAHLTTKYKCPYCPYVANAIVDIKRHIQKNKKHEGMKMYSCQKCSFAADCDRQFKEHLRAYHFGFEANDAVIDYFIEEMFSNKNKQRTCNDDRENINRAINSNDTTETVIAINSITMNTNNNNSGQQTSTNEVTPPLVKKFAGIKDHQQCLVTANNDITNQSLNIQIASDRNAGQTSQTFYNLELTTAAAVSSTNVPLLFTSGSGVGDGNQRLSNAIKSIPLSSVTIVPQQHGHEQHQHQLHVQQPQTATLLSVPSDANLNQLLNHHATLISVEEQASNNNHVHHQQSTNSSQDNGGQDSSLTTSIQQQEQIPVTITTQYLSYTNY